MCYDRDDINHNCDVCGLNICKDGPDNDHLCDVCYDYVCVNCCEIAPILLFATSEDCYVNGVKMARIFHNYYSKTVCLTYEGNKTLLGWEIYDINENLIFTIGPDDYFLPENDGKYYFVAIFADAEGF
jgi:hypothetical protein